MIFFTSHDQAIYSRIALFDYGDWKRQATTDEHFNYALAIHNTGAQPNMHVNALCFTEDYVISISK